MPRPSLRSIAGCSLLLLAAAASPSLALSLSVLPARPVEGQPFILVAGLVGSCPVPDSVVIAPGVVTVKLIDPCPAPGRPTLLEVPIGPLSNGPWSLRVQIGGDQAALPVDVARLPFQLDIDPLYPGSVYPQAGKL